MHILTDSATRKSLEETHEFLDYQLLKGDPSVGVLLDGGLWTDVIPYCEETCDVIDISDCSLTKPFEWRCANVLTCPGSHPCRANDYFGDILLAVENDFGKKLVFKPRYEVAEIILFHLKSIIESGIFHS